MFVTLMYHIVDRRIDAAIAVSETAFEAQLRHLRRDGCDLLTLERAIRIVRGEEAAPERGVLVTFDDGYADNLYAAMPRLREHGVEATMFVPTAYIGQSNAWNTRATYSIRHLDWRELQRWLALGGRIGGHTHAHERATEVSPPQLRASIDENGRLLAERLGVTPAAFAYPYGTLSAEAREAVAARYEIAFSVEEGSWDPCADRFAINRMAVDHHYDVLTFARELERRFAGTTGRRGSPGPAAPTPVPVREPPAGAPRVVIVTARDDDVLRYPPAARLVDLLEHGVDAHLVHDGRHADFPAWDDATLRARVHPPPLGLRGGRPRAQLLAGLLAALARRPLRLSAALARSGRRPLRYQRAIVAALDPDVVHLPAGSSLPGWLRMRGALRGRFLAPAAPETVGRADALFTSPGSDEAFGVATCVPALFDRRPFRHGLSPTDAPGGPLSLVAVGPVTWQAGYEHLVHAVRLLLDRGVPVECAIVGDGEHADAVRYAIGQLSVGHAVTFVAEGGEGELADQLLAADVLVNPAVAPARPRLLAAAQSLGLVLVTTPFPGWGSEPGLEVAPRDAAALADALERVACHPEVRSDLAQAARRRAAALPGIGDQLARFRELTLELAR